MQTLRKTRTFRVGSSPIGHAGPRIEIFVVHSFNHGTGNRNLKRLMTTAKEHLPYTDDLDRVSYYFVDPIEIGKEGTPRFQGECNKLAKRITEKICSFRTGGKRSERLEKRLVLVSHGLGTWMVKYCLSMNDDNYNHIRNNTFGCIFLDVDNEQHDEISIQKLVNRIVYNRTGLVRFLSNTREKSLWTSTADTGYGMQRNNTEKWRYRSPSPNRTAPDIHQQETTQKASTWPGSGLKDANTSMSISTRQKQDLFDLLKQIDKNFQKVHQEFGMVNVFFIPCFDDVQHHSKSLWSSISYRTGLKQDIEFKNMDETHMKLNNVLTSLRGQESPEPTRSKRQNNVPVEEYNMPQVPETDEPEDDKGPRKLVEPTEIKMPQEYKHAATSDMRTATLHLFTKFVERGQILCVTEQSHHHNPDDEIEKLLTETGSYARLGDLKNADTIYEHIIRLCQSHHPSDSRTFLLHLRRAKLWHRMGRYEEAKQYYECIKKCAASVMDCEGSEIRVRDLVLWDLPYYEALTQLRLGDYSEVQRLLADILKRMDLGLKSISEKTTIAPETYWDEHFRIAFRSKQILALNNVTMGHFETADSQLADLQAVFKCIDLSKVQDGVKLYKLSIQKAPLYHSAAQYSNDSGNQRWEEILASLKYTSAMLSMLRGRYGTALSASQESTQIYRRVLGPNDLVTLECQSLQAQLLAYNSHALQAEALCNKVLQAMSGNFGSVHPSFLETIGVLVFILRRQSRRTEALVTAKGLCRRCDEVLGLNHPITWQSKSQLASIHLSNGRYRDAVEVLREIPYSSEDERYSAPSALRYQAELALALFHQGETKAASERIRNVILKQKRVPTNSDFKGKSAELQGRPGFLISILRDLQQPSGHGYTAHPHLVYSLGVLATITARSSIKRAIEIFESVLSSRQVMEEAESDEQDLLKWGFELALLLREQGEILRAENRFAALVPKLIKVYGPSSSFTMSARSELLVTRFMLGSTHQSLITQLDAVKRQQETELGKIHPDTLRTCFSLLVVQTRLHSDQNGLFPYLELLQRLRDDKVRNQRLFESLMMEQRVAQLCSGQTKRYGDMGLKILDHLHSELKEDQANQVRELGLESVVSDVETLRLQLSSPSR